MSWRRTFGLDPIEFIIFWLLAFGLGVGLADLSHEDGFIPLALSVAAGLYVFVRRRALGRLGREGQAGDDLAELRDDQRAATDYFERRITEIEERLDFTERMLARAQDEMPLLEPRRGGQGS